MMITATGLLISPSLAITKYSGNMNIWIGTVVVARK